MHKFIFLLENTFVDTNEVFILGYTKYLVGKKSLKFSTILFYCTQINLERRRMSNWDL